MKITHHETVVTKVDPADKRAAQNQAEAARPQQAGDRVSLSPRARELLAARRALEVIPEVRADKIAEIKARIEKGSYRIDGRAIADKMIRDAFENDR